MITLAACRYDGVVYSGKRHAYIMWEIRLKFPNARVEHDDQGFLNEAGEFISREEAAELAYRSGQTKTRQRLLFSEDIIEVDDEDVAEANYNCDLITKRKQGGKTNV